MLVIFTRFTVPNSCVSNTEEWSVISNVIGEEKSASVGADKEMQRYHADVKFYMPHEHCPASALPHRLSFFTG